MSRTLFAPSKAIPTARKKREVLAVVQALGDSAAAAAALTSDMVSRRPSLSAARERAVAWIRMARPVRPAAGTGSTFDVGSNVWIGVAANALPSRAHPERLICVRAAGSAMEPTICEGDFVAVDPRRKALHDGQPFAVDVGAELLLRRLRRSGRRWLLSRDHQ